MLMYVQTEALLALSSKYTRDVVRVIFSQVDIYVALWQSVNLTMSNNIAPLCNSAVPMRRDGRSMLAQN